MKILNRSNSTKDIKWLANGSADVDIKEIVLRFKNLVLNKGTKAFDEINEELNLIIPQSYKVKSTEIKKSELLVSDSLKQLKLQVVKILLYALLRMTMVIYHLKYYG